MKKALLFSLLGLILGIPIGLALGLTKYQYFQNQIKSNQTVQEIDFDENGVTDRFYIKEDGIDITEEDINQDGKADYRYEFKNGILQKTMLDQNKNGNWDSWRFFEMGLLYSMEADKNEDGTIDFNSTQLETSQDYTYEVDRNFDGEFDFHAKVKNGMFEWVLEYDQKMGSSFRSFEFNEYGYCTQKTWHKSDSTITKTERYDALGNTLK